MKWYNTIKKYIIYNIQRFKNVYMKIKQNNKYNK